MKSTIFVGVVVGVLGLSFSPVWSSPSSDDSSVGKEPLTLAALAPLPYFNPAIGYELPGANSFFGKPPFIMVEPGPPPHAAGPGLRFNTRSIFYIYTDKNAPQNHFIPSGWMGDYGDITINDASKEDPADGKTCFKIHYSAAGSQHVGWAGMFWQEPINNWGDKSGGYDLTGFKRLTFWARGLMGGEHVAIFRVGGIVGKHTDSGTAFVGPVLLTQDWQKYTIDLSDVDLSHIAGGFAWAASSLDNPTGMTFYLDEIRFEK